MYKIVIFNKEIFLKLMMCIILCISELAVADSERIAIGVKDFTNQSFININKYNYLKYEIPKVLKKKMSNNKKLLVLSRGKKFVKEINRIMRLSKKERSKLKPIQGAKSILSGSYMILSDKIRIDISIKETRSGLYLMSDGVDGKISNLLPLIDILSGKVNDYFKTKE
jgi:hypothetical protein